MDIGFLISHIVGFAILLILGLAVMIRNSKSATNILFAVFIFEFLIYLIVNYLSLIPDQPLDRVLLWIRWVMAITSFTGPTMFLLAHTFPRPVLALPIRRVVILGFLGLLSAFASLSPYLFTSVVGYTSNNVPLPAPGPLILLYFISVPVLWVASFIVLIRKYKQSAGYEKSQLAYFLYGIVINLSYLIVLGIVAVNIFKTSAFIPYMPLSFVALIAFIAYAILKNRFLDIRVTMLRAITFILLLAVSAAVYFDILFVVSLIFTKSIPETPTLVVASLFGILIAISFQPIYKELKRFLSRFLYKDMYDSETVLLDIARLVIRTFNFKELTEGILHQAVSALKPVKAALLVVDKQHQIQHVQEYNYSGTNLKSSILEDFLHLHLNSLKRILLFNEITDDNIKTIFRNFDIEILIPIVVKDVEVAILVLGQKQSGYFYGVQDIQFLELFSSNIASALQNAIMSDELKILSESKSRFISVVSHQLRTPISGIRWSLETLMQGHFGIKDRRSLLENTHKSSVFLGEQLDDILTALDIYDNQLFIKKEICNLKKIFKGILEEYAANVKEKQLIVNCNISNDVDEVTADYNKLERAARILFKNAIHYSPAGGTVEIRAKLENFNGQKRVMVSFSDKGMGIAESERDHIFEEFFRSDKARSILPDGLGLGMFIAQAFIKAHGGEIWFYSEGRNKGADFHFSLPA